MPSHQQPGTAAEDLPDPSLRRPPGRPRSEPARRAILHATLALLEKRGFADLTIEEIAAQADVGKTTIYRWWPSRAALVADAFASSSMKELGFPDTGSVVQDISQQMSHLIRVLRGRRGRIVAALIAGGQSDPDLIEAFRERFLLPRRQEAYQTLGRAIARGELDTSLDMDLTLDSLYGPIYMRFLIRHGSLDDDFVHRLCVSVLTRQSARPGNSRQ